jgi:hypothetical protein
LREAHIAIVTASTCEMREGSILDCLVSLRPQVGTIVVVWRSSPQEAHTDLPLDLIGQTDHIVRVGHVGVSEARNAGLDRLADLGLLDEDHVVSFPDDDCVYPSDLTTALNWTGTSIVCIPYGPSGDRLDRRRFPSTSFAVRALDVPSVVASAGVFVRASLLLRFRFDESLGVGTRSSAGEELDLVLRLMASGAEAEYRSQPYVVHAYGSPRPERMRGGVAALRFNAKSFPVLYWLIARRLVTALKMTIRARDLGPAKHALSGALCSRRHAGSADGYAGPSTCRRLWMLD